jgi:hypothetical protein
VVPLFRMASWFWDGGSRLALFAKLTLVLVLFCFTESVLPACQTRGLPESLPPMLLSLVAAVLWPCLGIEQFRTGVLGFRDEVAMGPAVSTTIAAMFAVDPWRNIFVSAVTVVSERIVVVVAVVALASFEQRNFFILGF